METAKENKSLGTEYFKIVNLCKIMEFLTQDLDEDTELDEKTERLYYLAITIKDMLLDNEDGFLDAFDTLDNIDRK